MLSCAAVMRERRLSSQVSCHSNVQCASAFDIYQYVHVLHVILLLWMLSALQAGPVGCNLRRLGRLSFQC